MNREEYERKLMQPKNTLDMTYHVARVTIHQDLRNSGDITMNNYWSDKENEGDQENMLAKHAPKHSHSDDSYRVNGKVLGIVDSGLVYVSANYGWESGFSDSVSIPFVID